MEVNGLPVPGTVRRRDGTVVECALVWPSPRETVRARALVWPSARETVRARAFARVSREFTGSRGGSSAVPDTI
ncbi:hypothetical protein CA984_34035 [Streptosporangium minutum]|uniref:Uncharacterized protein n=1 Tax=Streptosporangium minutum TaxID=569862 RepID=A0A243R9V2_9ACTN|nr:hypothetical protein CA984_34035 [Streptosporangium minutum]